MTSGTCLVMFFAGMLLGTPIGFLTAALFHTGGPR
jgi:hypothetical protein